MSIILLMFISRGLHGSKVRLRGLSILTTASEGRLCPNVARLVLIRRSHLDRRAGLASVFGSDSSVHRPHSGAKGLLVGVDGTRPAPTVWLGGLPPTLGCASEGRHGGLPLRRGFYVDQAGGYQWYNCVLYI